MADNIAVLTGASRGLGRSIAVHLARAGVDVVGTYRSRQDEADATAAEIRAAGRRAEMLPLDANQTGNFAGFANTLSDVLRGSFGRPDFDFLINNAGIGINAPFADTTEEQFDQLVQIQLKAPFFLTQKLLPLIVDGGRILNVSSGLARFTLPGFSAYAATKGAIEVLTRYQAKELGPRRSGSTWSRPARSRPTSAAGRSGTTRPLNQAIASTVPLGLPGLPDDVGGAVAAILSDGFSWVNGARIEVSGGQNV